MNSLHVAKGTNSGVVFSWSSILLFDVYLLAILIIATRLATLLHELMGHGLMAIASGGHVNGIRISLLGGGCAFYDLKDELGLVWRFLVAFGGIFANIVSGLLAFTFIRRLDKKPEWALFFVLFAMVSLLGATAYCTLGFYYDQGDPVAWIETPAPGGGWLWILFLFISPFVSYLAVKSYSIVNEQLFPSRTTLGRVGVVAPTLGMAGCAYAGLYGFSGEHLVALDASSLAYQSEEKEIVEKKMKELSARLRKFRSELSEEELKELVERTPIVVDPKEIPQRFPLMPVIAFLYVAGALMAIQRVHQGSSDSLMRLAPRSMILAVALAGAVLGVLAWTGGWVYRSGVGLP